MKKNYVLAFETSCDETCAAVVDGDLNVLSNVISSQIDIHKLYGGVVPEVASRNHLLAVQGVCDEALCRANVSLSDISKVAATSHPGLVGAVMVGWVFAESLATALGVPFVGVNHLAGHIASAVISNQELKPPFLCLLVSGGHTSLYKIQNYKNIKLLGETTDDACGEAFDKVSKILGLGYPGGPVISKTALENPNPNTGIKLAQKANYSKDLNFSYSGLKSAVINYIKKNPDYNTAEICDVFQREAIEQLVKKCALAQKQLSGKYKLAVCGGVSANNYLRQQLPEAFFPDISLCGDNAAMIAAAAILDIRL